MQRLGALVCGIVLGMVVMAAIPVGAHHGDSTRRLKNQIGALKNRLSGVESAISFHNSRISSLESRTTSTERNVSSLDSRLRSVESSSSNYGSRISTLESRTRRLRSDGTISGDYVTPGFFCSYGDIAVWDFYSLDC